MVMHASKHPRLSDGFHDRSEAHPFQTVERFPSKSHSGNSESGSQDSMSTTTTNTTTSAKTGDHHLDHHHQREQRHIIASKQSPNQRSSVSPGTRPTTNDRNSPRTYRNKESYLQRQRDKQKSLGSSPAEHVGNHHGTNSHVTEHEKHIKEILAKAGEWTEHTSSSGKKYYYNCRTEVSQWEKPREWLEREKLQRVLGTKEKTKEFPRPSAQSEDSTPPTKRDLASSVVVHVYANNKHSNDASREKPSPQQSKSYPDRPASKPTERPSVSSSRTHDRPATTTSTTSTSTLSSLSSSSSSSSSMGCHGSSSSSTTSSSSASKKRSLQSTAVTPSGTPAKGHSDDAREDRNRKHENADYQQPNREQVNNKVPRVSGGAPVPSCGGRLAGLSLATDIYGRLKPLVSYQRSDKDRTESPRLRMTPSPGTPNATPSPAHHHHHPPSKAPHPHHNSSSSSGGQSNQQALHPSAAHKLFPARSPSVDRHAPHQQHADRVDEAVDRLSNQSPISVASVSDLSSPAVSQQSPRHQHQQQQPAAATPLPAATQPGCNPKSDSQNSDASAATPSSVKTTGSKGSEVKQERLQAGLDNVDGRSAVENQSLEDDKEATASLVSGSSPTPSPSSSQSGTVSSSLPTTPQKPTTPTIITLTPSLAAHYKEQFVKHVTGWSSELLERQAQRLFEESHTLGAELCAQVSADLKFARSLVRASEIQATLQEQRVLFLRQQAKDLEKLRNENAYKT